MIQSLLDVLAREFSGERAAAFATEIQRTDRWSSWDRYRETAEFCVGTMRAAGLEAEWRELPSDGETRCGDWIMPRAWDAHGARLSLVRERGPELVCDYLTEPCCLAMWSSPTPAGGAEYAVVHLEDAERESTYAGVDLAGKILFTRTAARAAKPIAARLGAAGVISDHASRHGRRDVFELADAVTWENSWKDRAQGGWGFTKADRECFGFLLSPRQGARFRAWLRDEREPRVRAVVDTRLYDGVIPAVTGVLRGETAEQVLAVGHLFEQGAIDNASGPAAIMEGLRALQALIAAGRLPVPRRSVRALFSVECAGTYACAAREPDLLAGSVAGVNVDCVGGALDATRAPLNVRCNPDASASFTDALLLHMMGSAARRLDYPVRVQVGRWLLDDNLIADPAIGIPCPLFGSWPYPAYHNSADDPALLDPRGLAFAGVAAAAYLYFIAAAGEAEARWLARLTGAEARAELGRVLIQPPEPEGATAERAFYLAERGIERVRSVRALAGAADVSEELALQARAIRSALEEELRASGVPEPSPTPPAPLGRVPRRRTFGSLQNSLVPSGELAEWQERLRAAGVTGDVPDCALFWADGKRSVGEIAGLVRHELGVGEIDLAMFFDGLAEYGYVEYRD